MQRKNKHRYQEKEEEKEKVKQILGDQRSTPTSVNVGFGEEFGTGTGLLRFLRLSLVSIVPPMLHIHSFIYPRSRIMFFSQYFSFPCQYHSINDPYSFIYHRLYKNLATDSVVKQHILLATRLKQFIPLRDRLHSMDRSASHSFSCHRHGNGRQVVSACRRSMCLSALRIT